MVTRRNKQILGLLDKRILGQLDLEIVEVFRPEEPFKVGDKVRYYKEDNWENVDFPDMRGKEFDWNIINGWIGIVLKEETIKIGDHTKSEVEKRLQGLKEI